jgi:hypothetical protein
MAVGVEVIGARVSMPGNESILLGVIVPDVNIVGRLEGTAVMGWVVPTAPFGVIVEGLTPMGCTAAATFEGAGVTGPRETGEMGAALAEAMAPIPWAITSRIHTEKRRMRRRIIAEA